eukprot:4986190-Prymnesium_polylepis.1
MRREGELRETRVLGNDRTPRHGRELLLHPHRRAPADALQQVDVSREGRVPQHAVIDSGEAVQL